MANKIQKVTIQAETRGFRKASKEVDNLSNAQDRTTRSSQNLGKASAASGRQFAAQASGLGGFVAAYAGAAANIFAVQQAFSALSRAAQVETTIRGTRTLAAEIGLSGDVIISKLQEVTQGQLTAAEAAQNANIALSAGFNTDQIEKLTEVATKASKALGRNLTESIQRVFRGAIKLEPELLDEIGIFTRIEPAVEKYAASLNRSVGSLTEFERRQAFANAVAEEGQRKFNEIDLSSSSAQKSLEQLSAKFLDLATKIGISLANYIEPFVSFLSRDFGNTLLVLGGIFTLVFRGAAQQVAQFTQSSVAGLNRALGTLENFSRKIGGTSEQFAAATGRAQQAAGAFAGQGAFAGRREIATEATKAKQAVMTGSIGSVAEAKAARDALKAQIAEERTFQAAVRVSNRTLEQKNAALDKSRGRTRALTAAIRELTAAEQQAGVASRVLAGGSRILSVAITGLGTAISFVLAKLNLLFFAVTSVQTILQFFGIDAIGAVVNWFGKLGKEQEMINKGFKGLVSSVTEVSQSMLELAGIKEASDYIRFVNKALDETSKVMEKVIVRSGFQVHAFNKLRDATDAEQIKMLQRKMELLRVEMNAGTGDIAKQTIAYNAMKDALKIVESGLSSFNYQIARGAEATGLSEKAFAGAIIRLTDMRTGLKIVNNEIEYFGQTIGTINNKGVAVLTEFGDVILDSAVKTENLRKTYQDAFNAGTITAEKASTTLVGFRNILTELEGAFDASGKSNKALAAAISAQTGEIEAQSASTERLLAAEKNLKTFRDTFSKEIRAVDTAISAGVLGIDGTLAKNAAEQQANRVKYLQHTINEFKKLNTEQQKGKNLNGDMVNIYQAGLAGLKAQAGIIIALPAKLEKIKVTEEKRERLLRQQLAALTAQGELLKVNELIMLNKLAKEGLNIIQKEVDLEKIRLDLQKTRDAALIKELRTSKELLQIEQERASLTSKLSRTQLEGRQLDSEFADQKALLAARIAVEETATSSSKKRLAARMKLLEVENQNALNEITRKKELAEFDYNIKIRELDNRKKLLEQEQTINNEKIAQLEKQNSYEYNKIIIPLQKLEDRKRVNEKAGLELQLKQLAEQEKINLAKIEADKENRLADLKIVEANYELLKGEIELAKSYIDSRKKLGELEIDIINGLLKAIGLATQVELPDLGKIDLDIGGSSIDNYIKDAKAGISEVARLQAENSKKQTSIQKSEIDSRIKLFDEVTALIEKERTLQNQLRTEKNQATIQEIEDTNKLIAGKLINIAKEKEIEKELYDNIIKNLNNEAALELLNHEEKVKQLKKEFDLITNIAEGLKSKIGGTLGNSVNEFFKSINEGTLTMKGFRDGVKDLFNNLLLDIQQVFIDKLITDPIKELAGDLIDKSKDYLVGLVTNRSADASARLTTSANAGASVSTDPIALRQGAYVGSDKGFDVDAEKKKTADLLQGTQEQTTGFLDKISSATIATFGTVLAATGDFKTAMIATFVQMFLEIAVKKAIAYFGANLGGKVPLNNSIQQFAGGGSVARRDRVPALLEPGEFVIRKPAAKAIGGSALNQLNATGKMNSGNNVVVNVQNNGTPQQVETTKVRNDTGQMIIDLVVKDIQNNGKVRKAMRG